MHTIDFFAGFLSVFRMYSHISGEINHCWRTHKRTMGALKRKKKQQQQHLKNHTDITLYDRNFNYFFFITLWILFEIPCQIAWFLPKKFTPFSVLPSVFNGGNFYRSILGDGVRLENTHVNSRQLSHAEWNETKNCSISGKWVNEKLIENCGTNAFSWENAINRLGIECWMDYTS